MRRIEHARVILAVAIVVALGAGCDPGWTNAALGTGDGTGTTPGSVAVASGQVALGLPTAMLDLGARGYLVYDQSNCTLLLVSHSGATRFAGTGTCGYTGDGGPAIDAQIDVVSMPLAAGIQADAEGNVYLFTRPYDIDPPGGLRWIDAVTGDISTVTALDGLPLFGMAPEADGRLVYSMWDDDTGTGGSYEIRQVDSAGTDTLIASLPSAERAAGFARVGPDHYVVPGVEGGSAVRIDVDHGVVSTTPTPTPTVDNDVMIYEAAGSDGSVYGISWDDDAGLDGNRVFRIRPDGTVEYIAGSGTPDPGTTRQMGNGPGLHLTAQAVALTRNGNLLIASGHTIYDLADAADAPGSPA